jgi:hypothetical protein
MYIPDSRARAGVDLNRLFAAQSRADVAALIASVERAKWRAYGDQEGNYALINATASSLDALIEKLTNGMDGLIELRALLVARSDFASPREAVEVLFNIPKGHLEHVTDWSREERWRLAENLSITLRDGDAVDEPTVVVKDAGIGQHPDDFPTTLTSLNRNNKRDKFHLIGAYGWGGSAALAFCEAMIFISRRDPRLLNGRPDEVGWTVVRYNDLAQDRTSKTGVYEYLTVEDDADPRGAVPRFSASELPPNLRDWSGTMCVLVNYDIGRNTARAAAFLGSQSLLKVCNAALVDPVLPLLVREERPKYIKQNPKNADGIVVLGNAARLSDLASRKKHKALSDDDTGEEEKEAREVGVVHNSRFHAQLPTGGWVEVRYWVMGQPKKYKKGWEPARNYVMPEQAITLSHNGQRHAIWGRELFETIGYSALGKSIVALVDADALDWTEKRRLFATTRDQLRRTDIAQALRKEVDNALRQDDYLRGEEKRRRERALSHESKEQAERIQQLLEKAITGYQEGNVELFRAVMSSNQRLPLYENQPLADPEPPVSDPQERPELQDFTGDPTYVRVLNAPVHVPAGGRAVVRVQINAPDDYFDRTGAGEFLPLITKGSDVFRLDGYSSLRNGVMRCTVSHEGGAPGDRGRIIFTITRGEALPISQDAELIADEPPRKRVKSIGTGRGKEQAPPVKPCHREQWDDIGDFDETVVARLVPEPSDPELFTIWVNWNYGPLDDKLLKERKLDEELANGFKERFVASMGFLAWLQKQAGNVINNDELRRAAQVHLFSTFMDR